MCQNINDENNIKDTKDIHHIRDTVTTNNKSEGTKQKINQKETIE